MEFWRTASESNIETLKMFQSKPLHDLKVSNMREEVKCSSGRYIEHNRLDIR